MNADGNLVISNLVKLLSKLIFKTINKFGRSLTKKVTVNSVKSLPVCMQSKLLRKMLTAKM